MRTHLVLQAKRYQSGAMADSVSSYSYSVNSYEDEEESSEESEYEESEVLT